MTTQELSIIVDALAAFKYNCTGDEYRQACSMYNKYLIQLRRKENNGYLVIRGSWSGYSGQTNCDKGCRRVKAIKMTKAKAVKHIGHHTQRFDDGSCNYWSYTFETDKPKDINNRLGGYEWWFKENGLLC